MTETISMVPLAAETLHDLYEADEPAWLEAMVELIRAGRHEELDYAHIAEYLADMARSDRRRVISKLVLLIAHLLKWEHQPERRSRSWLGTIERTRQELEFELQSGVLRNHAVQTLAEAYDNAVKLAAVETGLPATAFPADCPFSLELLLDRNIDRGAAAEFDQDAGNGQNLMDDEL